MQTIRFIIITLIITILGLNGLLTAQDTDSVKTVDIAIEKVDSSIVTYYFDKSAFSQDYIITLDTTLNFFQRYDPLRKDYDMVANTMIVGGPHKNLSFSSKPTSLLSIGENNLFAYYFTPENVKHYNPHIPYSEVFYSMAAQEQNLLRVTLGNQISDRLYFGLDFDVESTIGLFTNQRVSSNQFQLNTEFNTLNKRYGFYVNYIRNKFKFGENGGLTDDYYYEDTTNTNRQVLAVNLNHATNTLKSNYFEFNQHILIGALPNDTLGRAKFGKIFLKSNFTNKNRIYQDQDTNYYNDFFIDSLTTFDSSNAKILNAAFGWTNDQNSLTQYFGINTQLNYQYSEYFDGQKSFYFNYLTPQVDIFIRNNIFYLELSGRYQTKLGNSATINIGDGDLFFNSDLIFNLNKFKVLAGLDFYNANTEIKTHHYYSNHFVWNKTLSKQTSMNINGGVDLNGYNLSTEIITINDYVYFDETVQPQQYAGSIGLLKLRFQKKFKFRKFGATAMGLYQSSSNNDFLRVPALTARASIYFSFPLFKGALIVHPGFDLTYMTSYYADSYDPALMQFHIQNDKSLDEQFYANFYVNFKIKRARVFVAYNHFNTLWGKYNYFLVTHYPQEDAILKFGMSWRFYR